MSIHNNGDHQRLVNKDVNKDDDDSLVSYFSNRNIGIFTKNSLFFNPNKISVPVVYVIVGRA